MPETVTRTLTLRTAVSMKDFGAENKGPGTLGNVLREVHSAFGTIRERRATFDGHVVEGRNLLEERDGMTLLHLVAYTPDDQISVVPRAGEEQAADLALIDAPEDTEFLDGEIMLLVKDNDVAICRSGLGEGALYSYVLQLADRHGLDSTDVAFQLMKRADVDKLAMIQREGVKRLSMNSLAHEASVARARRETVREAVLGNLLDEIKAILGVDERIPQDAENLKVEVLLTFDKRRGTEIDQRQLSFLAQQMLEEDEDEGFMIETLSGRKFRANDIVLSEPVRITSFGKSIHHMEAWGALREFYRKLSERPRHSG